MNANNFIYIYKKHKQGRKLHKIAVKNTKGEKSA